MTETQIIIITVIIILVISLTLIILSGLFIVKNDEICVFEKFYKYYCSKTKGVYFFTPFITRRVGKYKLDNQYLKINLKDNKIYLIYKIDDAKLYHYNNKFNDEIYARLLTCEEENNNFLNIIKSTCKEYGIITISIKINEELID